MTQPAQEPAVDQLTHDAMAFEAERARDDLANQIGVLARGSEHAVRLGSVHAHARLGQDVLAGVEGGEGYRTMKIRPGANDNGIDLGIANDFFPRRAGAWDVKFARDGGGRFGAAVADGDDLDAGD